MGRGHRGHLVPPSDLSDGLLFSDLCLQPAGVRRAQRARVMAGVIVEVEEGALILQGAGQPLGSFSQRLKPYTELRMVVKWLILHLLRDLEMVKGLKTLGKWGKYKFCWKNYGKLILPVAEIREVKCSEGGASERPPAGSRTAARAGGRAGGRAVPVCRTGVPLCPAAGGGSGAPSVVIGHITMET